MKEASGMNAEKLVATAKEIVAGGDEKYLG
jgi:hypothetical protein